MTVGWDSCETWTKKFVRFQVYRHILLRLGDNAFSRARFLYLASGDGGDASVLEGFGIPPSQQLAVDHNPDALAAFEKKFPGVPTFCGDVADVDGHFDVVFVDFYSNIASPTIAQTLISSSWRLARRDDRFFVFAVMSGREAGQTNVDIMTQQIVHKRFIDAGPYGEVDPKSIRVAARILLMYQRIFPEFAARHIGLVPEFVWAYPGRKVPMAVAGFRTKAFPRKWSHQKFVNRNFEWQMSTKSLLGDPRFYRIEHVFPKLQKEDVLAYINECDLWDGAALFNIPPRTLAAYKAHWTLGTYQKPTGGEGDLRAA